MAKKRRSSKSGSSAGAIASADDAPLTLEELDASEGTWTIGGEPVSEEVGTAALHSALSRKKRVNIHIDEDTIERYKQKAAGRGYQTLINEDLRRLHELESMEQMIRRVVREEVTVTVRDAVRASLQSLREEPRAYAETVGGESSTSVHAWRN
jgi:uncharacterized protein (DUF4415 family)